MNPKLPQIPNYNLILNKFFLHYIILPCLEKKLVFKLRNVKVPETATTLNLKAQDMCIQLGAGRLEDA